MSYIYIRNFKHVSSSQYSHLIWYIASDYIKDYNLSK